MANMTKLDAVNELLEAIGLKPVTALDTGNFSEAGDAERTLDRESRRVQMRGFYGNQIKSKAYVASGSLITPAADVIAIKSAGPTQHRNFALREQSGTMRAYDLDADTFTITGTIYLDITVEIPFADAPPDIQDAIVADAKQKFQRRFRANPEADQALAEERVQAELTTGRVTGRSSQERAAAPPFALSQPGQQAGG